MQKKTRKVTLGPGVCDGCGKCVEACVRDSPKKQGKGAKKTAGIKLLRNGSSFIPVICRNCEDAPCATACMSGGRHRDGKGRVITDYSRCTGCWMCIMNCPFGAIERVESRHVALKCEGCPDEDVPRCVGACKMGILSCQDVQDVSVVVRRKAAVRFLAGDNEDISNP
jgi:anaerobic carbon-monoxide dehydrogenase iron sulfur subunit